MSLISRNSPGPHEDESQTNKQTNRNPLMYLAGVGKDETFLEFKVKENLLVKLETESFYSKDRASKATVTAHGHCTPVD